ncbi:MAG: sulfite exporter TauE/SafE family protein [Hyphomicrobiaceae bacterium]
MTLGGLSPVEAAGLVSALLIGGLVVGFLSGLIGIGGGGILVPVLYELFRLMEVPEEVRMHMAVGTSLAVITPTSIRSFLSHRARGAVDEEVLWRLGPAVMAGVGLGVLIAHRAPGDLLKLVFAVFCAVMALRLIVGSDRLKIAAELPGPAVCWPAGLFIGGYCALIGIGGGAFVTTFMQLHGRPILKAVATAAGFGPIIALPGTIGYIWAGLGAEGLPPGSAGFVSVLGALIIVPASVLAAPAGVRLAHGLSRRTLEYAFAAFLIAVGIRFTIALVG